jgi:hypothetical protein
MLLLDEMRAEFARFLAEDPQGRWRMDKALAHVVSLAYTKGVNDGLQRANQRSDRCPNHDSDAA